VRRAQSTPRWSIDSGYHSQSFRSSSSIVSPYTQLTDDPLPLWGPLATSDRHARRHGFAPFTEYANASQSRYESGLGSPWSSVQSQPDEVPTDSSFSQTVSQQSFESPNFSETAPPRKGQSLHQNGAVPGNPQVSFPGKCGNHNRLSSCTLGFCAPHALPSICWAAHTGVEIIGLKSGPLSCRYCDATKLHHLASMAQVIELWYFKEVLLQYLPIIGQCDRYGNSCVHFAAGSGASLAQFEALACAGAPMKLSNDAGQTFLHCLNTRLYDSHTLHQIIQWAIRTNVSMTERDGRKRTVWHSLFQRGISSDVFRNILPHLLLNKDDMTILDSENHTPLDCLRSYWTSNNEATAIDDLNLLQSSGILPLYFAVNRTLPLDDPVSAVTATGSSAIPALSSDVSRLTTGPSTKRHDFNDSRRYYFDEILSIYKNGGELGFNTIKPQIPISRQPTWPARTSSLPKFPEKTRRVIGP
jgi:hypothetical protein